MSVIGILLEVVKEDEAGVKQKLIIYVCSSFTFKRKYLVFQENFGCSSFLFLKINLFFMTGKCDGCLLH